MLCSDISKHSINQIEYIRTESAYTGDYEMVVVPFE